MMGSNVALKDTSCHLNDSTKPNELWSPLQWWVIQGFAREAQLKMLRYQLNPHFLFNTLNAVSALVRLSDALTKQVNFA